MKILVFTKGSLGFLFGVGWFCFCFGWLGFLWFYLNKEIVGGFVVYLFFKNEVMSLINAKACAILPASLETVRQQ